MNIEELYSQYISQSAFESHEVRTHVDGHSDYHNDGAWNDNGYDYHTDAHNDIG